MVYIKLYGHDFMYETLDILKLFYNDNEIIIAKTEMPEDTQEIYILSKITNNDKEYFFESKIYYNKIMVVSEEYSLSLIELKSGIQDIHNRIKKLIKHELKRNVYNALCKYTGQASPWGILTGIRPSKIVHEMIKNNKTCSEISHDLEKNHGVEKSKALELYNIAKVEENILNDTKFNMVSVYIGIPFCPTKCLYCSFTSLPYGKYKPIIKEYIRALKKEIVAVSEIIKQKGFIIQSLYIGGGTPTSLSVNELSELLQIIEQNFDLDDITEYTIEAGRPDTINRDKLNIIKNSRAKRISINPQTLNDEVLKIIGRSHNYNDFVNAYNLARNIGFDNINMDIIVGLPGDNMDSFQNTLEGIKEMSPESLTVHTLCMKRASVLNKNKSNFEFVSADTVVKMVEVSKIYASNMKMHPYYLYRQKNMLGNLENIGYCKPGYESIYNIQIMEEMQTIIALGAGGITKVVYPNENRIERAFNVKDVYEYIKRIDEMIERKIKLF